MNSLLYSRHWFSFLQRKVRTFVAPIFVRTEQLFLDIAVDGTSFFCFTFVTTNVGSGWALTLLSQENLSYASTCQTIGLNTGFFASFTVFLALNSEAFA
jgi:hypothetical protein